MHEWGLLRLEVELNEIKKQYFPLDTGFVNELWDI